jgi:hypothetical protein
LGNLIIGLTAGVIGMAYFAYGKRAQKFAPMLCGILLGLCPMFTDNLVILAVISAALLAAPFFTDF